MESKRKKRKVHKANSAPSKPTPKPTTEEALIVYNADLVEQLFISEAWREIAFPLLRESIASVSGRFTKGRFYQGSLTKSNANRDELAGYQLALEEFYNRLVAFIDTRELAIKAKKEAEIEKEASFYNPYLEEGAEY